MLKMTIRGIQEAQRANLRMLAAVKTHGALGRAVQWGIAAAHRYAVAITHVDTGALRASHRTAFSEARHSAIGRMFIDPSSVNPHGHKPVVYGPEEHDRGGSHAFYERVLDEKGVEIARQMGEIVIRSAK